MAGLKAGNATAYAELVERYSSTVYNLALRLMSNPQEAEEVLQETFLSAFRAMGRFESRSRLSTWLYRIAYNASMMRLRKREVAVASLDEPFGEDESDEEPRQVADWAIGPDQLALTGELYRVLDRAVAALPETQRAVFVLRDIEGLSTLETAESLGLTEANVKVRLHRARLALRQYLTPYFSDGQSVAGGGSGRRPAPAEDMIRAL